MLHYLCGVAITWSASWLPDTSADDIVGRMRKVMAPPWGWHTVCPPYLKSFFYS